MCLSCPVPASTPTPTFPRDQPHPASPDLPPESRASLSSLSPRVRSRTDCQLVLLSSRYGAWTHISPHSPRCPCVCAAENELLLPSIQAGASSPPYRSESSHAHNGSSQRAHPPLLSGSAPYARASLHVTRPKASAHPPPSPPPQVLPRNEYVSPRPAIAPRLLSLPSRFSPPPHPPRPVRTTPPHPPSSPSAPVATNNGRRASARHGSSLDHASPTLLEFSYICRRRTSRMTPWPSPSRRRTVFLAASTTPRRPLDWTHVLRAVSMAPLRLAPTRRGRSMYLCVHFIRPANSCPSDRSNLSRRTEVQ